MLYYLVAEAFFVENWVADKRLISKFNSKLSTYLGSRSSNSFLTGCGLTDIYVNQRYASYSSAPGVKIKNRLVIWIRSHRGNFLYFLAKQLKRVLQTLWKFKKL